MRTAIALVLALAVVASAAETSYPSWVYDTFDSWCIRFDKTFDSPSEREFRVGVFYSNLQYIETTNAAQDSYTLGLNGFSALTVEEFIQMHTGLLPVDTEAPQTNTADLEGLEYPTSYDWTTQGAVTGVKNQGQCGSCWSFSTTGGLEGLNVIQGNSLQSFSEQQIMDCSGKYGTYSCNGGWPQDAYQYTAAAGIEGESTYPYTAKDGTCHYESSEVLFQNSGFKEVTRRSSSAFLTALGTIGPVSIGIDAEKIMSYTSGIFNEAHCGTQIDHAVLAVGYDTSAGYIKVKNSWGTTWGESGYIRFALLGNGSGECGMYLTACYPTA